MDFIKYTTKEGINVVINVLFYLGDGVEIGCGCVLAPGCIVGKNTTAYPLTFLRGTIPENSIVKSMNEIVEKRI